MLLACFWSTRKWAIVVGRPWTGDLGYYLPAATEDAGGLSVVILPLPLSHRTVATLTCLFCSEYDFLRRGIASPHCRLMPRPMVLVNTQDTVYL